MMIFFHCLAALFFAAVLTVAGVLAIHHHAVGLVALLVALAIPLLALLTCVSEEDDA